MQGKTHFRSNRGITVTSLTITIIVLLILAAVTIKVMIDNELISEAKEAKENYEQAEQAELERASELKNYRNGKYAVSEENNGAEVNIKNSTDSLLLKNYRIYGNSFQDTATYGEPSPSNPVEIQSVGDRTNNLFNYKDYIKNGNTKEIENGIQFEITNSRIDIGINFTFKANTTYILSAECTEDAAIGGQLYNGFVSYNWCNNTIKQITITNSSDIDVTKKISCVDKTGTKGSTIKFAMLEVGSTKTEYEPYGKYKIPVTVSDKDEESITTNIYLDEPLRRIDSYADYIDFESGKVVRKIKSDNNLSDNTFAVHNTLLNNGYYRTGYFSTTLPYSKFCMLSGTGRSGYCNVLAVNKYSWGTPTSECIRFGQNNTALYIYTKNSYASSEELLTYLGDVCVEYILKEQIEETINLPDLPIYEGDTKIKVDTTIAPSKIEINY